MPRQDVNLRFVVAGGGIAGLSAAIALANIGCHITVLEKTRTFSEVGAGMQVGPNGLLALERLGLAHKVKQMAVRSSSLKMMDAVDGLEIARIPIDDEFCREFDNPYAVIHRADLHKILFDECKSRNSITLLTDKGVVGFDCEPAHVNIQTSDGMTYTANGALGCDGLHSVIRKQITGADDLRITGHVSYRATVPVDRVPESLRNSDTTLWAGPKCHVVHYPLKGGNLFNLVATLQQNIAHDVPGGTVTRQEVVTDFAHVTPLLLDMLRGPETWGRWALADRHPAKTWTKGRTTLLGDAAHPTLQYLAQGGCMALEDSVSLSRSLVANRGDVINAFQAYEKDRMHRTYEIVSSSRKLGEIYHAEGPRRIARNALFARRTARDLIAELRWLYAPTPNESWR